MTPTSTTTATAPTGDNVSEIHILTSSVQGLEGSFNSWNAWYVGFVFATVVVAAAVFFTQFMAIRKGKQLAAEQSKLLKVKDDNLAVELKDKDIKIADATRLGQEAKERAEKLENDNLTLRGQVATLEGSAAKAQKDVAGLQKAASDAKAAQQKVEIDLEKQKERTATAEKNLLELQERIKDRHLSAENRKKLVALLKAGPTGEITVSCVGGHPEPCTFAAELVDALKAGGWVVTGFNQGVMFVGSSPSGLILQVHSAEKTPARSVTGRS